MKAHHYSFTMVVILLPEMKYLLLLFGVFLCACNKNTAKEINVIPLADEVGTYSVLNLSDYVTDIRYIPLETSDLSLISGIEELLYENEKILVNTNWKRGNTLVFDNNGAFCNVIGDW